MIGWILSIILFISWIVSDISNNKKIQEKNSEILELKAEITKLKDNDYVQKQKRVMELQAQQLVKALDVMTEQESIKVARVPLGNFVKTFKSNYVYLQLKGLHTLEITDGCSTVTVNCERFKRKETK